MEQNEKKGVGKKEKQRENVTFKCLISSYLILNFDL